MHSRHHLPHRVERPLSDTGILLFGLFLPDSACFRHLKKRQFRRVSNRFFPCHLRILTKRKPPEKHFRNLRLLPDVMHRNRYMPVIDIASCHGHFILCQSSRLIRTDHIDRPQCFHRWKFPHDRIDTHHARDAHRKNNRHDRRKTLRHRCDCQRNRCDQHFNYIPLLQDRNPEQQHTKQDGNDTEQFPQFGKFFLKRRILSWNCPDHRRDFSDFRLHSRRRDNSLSASRRHKRGHKRLVLPLTDRRLFHLVFFRSLFYRNRFSCQRRLLDL